ncbi:MAG: STAS domain-containing protein [Spirochaetales bacterium]|jgi:anti-anti-sigma factor|nr:STAS domain-containing protein [Spirochaetales bacterium]
MIQVSVEGQFTVISFGVDHIDSTNHKEFKELVSPYIVEDAKFIFDISALKFIDSSGLGSFLSILRDLKELDGDVTMFNPGTAVKMLFDLVRLDKVIRVFPDRESAEQGFA